MKKPNLFMQIISHLNENFIQSKRKKEKIKINIKNSPNDIGCHRRLFKSVNTKKSEWRDLPHSITERKKQLQYEKVHIL